MVTDAQRHRTDDLRNIPLPLVCESLGLTYFKSDQQWKDCQGGSIGVSLKKDGRGYFDHKSDAAKPGGYGAINLVCHVTGEDFKYAVTFLSEHFGFGYASDEYQGYIRSNPEKAIRELEEEKPPIEITDRPDRWPEAFSYLTEERMISPRIVQRLRDKGHILASAHGDPIFVATDQEGRQRLGSKRLRKPIMKDDGSRLTHMTIKGSCRKYVSALKLGKEMNTVVIFESDIDRLSWIDLQMRKKTLPTDACLVSTSGARSTLPTAVRDAILKAGTVREIRIAFDDDPPLVDGRPGRGNRSASALENSIGETEGMTGIRVIREVPGNGIKDFNDLLKSIVRRERGIPEPIVETPVVVHPVVIPTRREEPAACYRM